MRYCLLAVIALLMLPVSALAQNDTCFPLLEEAVTTAADSCLDLGPNEVCLGYPEVDTVVDCEGHPEFDSPGDTLPLDSVCALRTGSVVHSGEWGIASLRIQPHALESDVFMVLFGGAEIQNAASAQSELQMWITEETNLLSGPGSSYDSIGTLSEGAVIRVNACNCTGNWMRTVLEDGRIGWLLARSGTLLGSTDALPVARINTPVYEKMQAFTLRNSEAIPLCSDAPLSGILIQVPSGMDIVPFQINGVEIWLDATAFIQSQPDDSLIITVLNGVGSVKLVHLTASIPAGTHAIIVLPDTDVAEPTVHVEPYSETDIVGLPLMLLPETIDPNAALASETPTIVGVETCSVISNSGETVCPVHFVNPDGDAIAQMQVDFVSAPEGDWSGSLREQPPLIDGDNASGRLTWGATCSLGSANFIGPVE